MKTTQKGFIVPLLLIIVAILLAGGGAYFYTQTKSENPPVVEDVGLPQATSTTQTTSQTAPVAQTSNSQTIDWKTYTNTQYGFQLDYINGTKLPDHMYGPDDNAIRFQPVGAKENATDSYVINVMTGGGQDYCNVRSVRPVAGGIPTSTQVVINKATFTKQDVIQDLPNSNIRFTEYCTQSKFGMIYLISMVPPVNTDVSDDPILNRVISSFKINP